MKAVIWKFVLVTLLSTSAGCTLASPPMKPSEEAQLPPSPVPSETISSIPTATLTPTTSATQPSPTSTQTIAPTQVDTLPPEIITATLEPLLREPMNCPVPCFWGIIPRKTDMGEVRELFGSLGFTPFEGYDPDSGRYFYTINYESTLGRDSAVTIFSNTENLVTNITIIPRLVKPEPSQPRGWIAFSPETLIAKYGQPSHVQFALGEGPNIGFHMLLYFDEKKLIVAYSGYDVIPDDRDPPLVCPLTATFDDVRLWMGTTPPDPPLFPRVRLEQATSLSIEQFTHLMLGDPEEACFVLNGDAFE